MNKTLSLILLISVAFLIAFQLTRPSCPTIAGAQYMLEPRPSDQMLLQKVAPWVHANTGYRTPSSTPIVVRAPLQFFADLVCGGVALGCAVAGLHIDGEDVLYILESLDDVEAEHIILHEYVHRLQFLDHGVSRGCHATYTEEYEAYRLQNKYRSQVMGYRGLFFGPPLNC